MAIEGRGSAPSVSRTPGGNSLADLLDRILDKGLVIDAWVRVSVVGIELLTIEARVVVASVDTYLRYAEAIAKTALAAQPQPGGERELPSEREVVGFLEDNPTGVGLSRLREHFGISEDDAEGILDRLASSKRLRRDTDRNLVLPASTEGSPARPSG
jgi:hypothetical protein